MNAGTSTTQLQADFKYRERGMATMLWTAELDTRSAGPPIASRIGLAAEAHPFLPETDFGHAANEAHATAPLACLLVVRTLGLSQNPAASFRVALPMRGLRCRPPSSPPGHWR